MTDKEYRDKMMSLLEDVTKKLGMITNSLIEQKSSLDSISKRVDRLERKLKKLENR